MKRGDRVNQHEICERLGVSRLPAGEALIAPEPETATVRSRRPNATCGAPANERSRY